MARQATHVTTAPAFGEPDTDIVVTTFFDDGSAIVKAPIALLSQRYITNLARETFGNRAANARAEDGCWVVDVEPPAAS